MKNVMVEKLQRGREDGISIDQIVTLKHLEAFEVELLAKIESLLSGLIEIGDKIDSLQIFVGDVEVSIPYSVIAFLIRDGKF